MRKYIGTYTVVNKKVVESDDLKIITSMLENDLVEICFNGATWNSLYYYPKDQTYWLHSYEGEAGFDNGIRVLTEIDVATAMRIKAEWQAKKNI